MFMRAHIFITVGILLKEYIKIYFFKKGELVFSHLKRRGSQNHWPWSCEDSFEQCASEGLPELNCTQIVVFICNP